MKINIRVLIFLLAMVLYQTIDAMHNDDQQNTEKQKVLQTLTMLQNQNTAIINTVNILHLNKDRSQYPYIVALQDRCNRHNTILHTISEDMHNPETQVTEEYIPKYEILTPSPLHVETIKNDLESMVNGNTTFNPVENFLYPFRHYLPGKINPWSVTALITAVPLCLGVASVLTSDEKSTRQEMVKGIFKTCFVGLTTAFASSYIARRWNPIQDKLQKGSTEDILQRINQVGEELDTMTTSAANYLDSYNNKKLGIKTLSVAQAAEHNSAATLLQLQQNTIQLQSIQQGLDVLQTATDILQKELQAINSSLKISTSQIKSWFHDEAQTRCVFENMMQQEFGQMRWMQLKICVNSEIQLKLISMGLLRSGISQSSIDKSIQISSPAMQEYIPIQPYASRPRLHDIVIYELTEDKTQLKAYIKHWNDRMSKERSEQNRLNALLLSNAASTHTIKKMNVDWKAAFNTLSHEHKKFVQEKGVQLLQVKTGHVPEIIRNAAAAIITAPWYKKL